MDREEEVGVGGGRGGSHGGPSLLVPECISKLEYIVAHDNGEGVDESICRDAGESTVVLVDILGYLDDSHASSDVGVHGGGMEVNRQAPGGRGDSWTMRSLSSLEFLMYVFWTVASFCRWESTQMPKWYKRLPLQETIGLVVHGLLWTLRVR